ncbi:MAG: beta-ketoacyl synthase N-terminal-like domain-containing protein [Legionellaceae bacterium]|nr:beta-ketoacyl synthase N-terminal-like domain-containing protein [Legionellaceae bacterium]
MSSNQRVFITGMSSLTSSGLNLEDTWEAILAGKTSLKNITGLGIENWENCLGGQIENYNEARMLPDKKLKKVISKQDNFGINAAMQAVEHSQLMTYKNKISKDNPELLAKFEDECGVFVGSPGNKYLQQHDFLPLMAKTNNMQEFAEQLFSEVHPMWLLRILPNNVLAYVGITYGFKGANHNITNHAVSGMQAIIEAYHAILSGQISRACVVAYDLGIEPQALYYYDKLGVLSKNSLKPFDMQHDGTVLAEGASAIILENEQSVKERNAKCYAEVIGGDSRTESSGLFSIEEEGQELKNLLANTLKKHHISKEDINLIVAHGNGNQKSDVSESIAINKVFGDVPLTSFKWSMGHTLCASGILDTVLATKSLRSKCIPGVANLTKVAKSCQGVNVSRETRPLEIKNPHAMIINRGFAGMNAALLIKACD